MTEIIYNTFEKKIVKSLELNNLANKSIKIYIRALRKLNDGNDILNFDFLNDPEQILESLKHFKPSTRKNYIAVVVSVLRYFNLKKYKSLYDQYNAFSIKMNKELDVENSKHEMTETQKKNWIDQNAVLEKLSDLKVKAEILKTKTILTKADYKAVFNYMLLALYVYIPPRRNADYLLMKISENPEDEQDTNYNYINVKKKTLIFNQYKGSRKKGQVNFKFDAKLNKVLTLYLKFKPIINNFLLVNYDGKPLNDTNDLTYHLNSIFDGKKISSSMLRHIFISNRFGNTANDHNEIANKMSHSISQQNKYIKIQSIKDD